MRVVVVGATGNVGTSLLRSLADDPEVDSVLGLARRAPGMGFPKTQWGKVDVSRATDLADRFAGADAVVHLAWLIQPGRDLETLHATNVEGSRRVFQATVDAGAPALRSVRLRPGLIFKRDAASEIRRLFAGPFLPSPLVRTELIPAVPDDPRLVFQAVHSLDAGEAYRLAVKGDVHGAFNIAAEPVLDPPQLAGMLGARRVRVPGKALRAGAAVSWRLRLQPSEPGWVDMALNVPIMDCSRAREELGWRPRRTSVEALRELLEGIRDGAGIDTPPLAPGTGGPLRIRELLTGVGSR